MAKKEMDKCSFCGKPKTNVQVLISGIDAQICDNCIEQANKLLNEDVQSQKNTNSTSFDRPKNLKPKDIKEYLDDYVIGQEEAKKVIAVAVYNHYKRLSQNLKNDEVEIEKSNIIMAGRTGTGKTLIVKSIAKLLKVPFTIVDATIFTEAGYVGEDVESIITRLLQVCNYDVETAEKGIVFIDEIDKISRKGDNPSLTRDIKEGTQQSLLKLIEGTDVLVPPQGGRKHPEQKLIKVDTKNILFVCGGSFDGIDRVISKRINTSTIGFKSNKAAAEIDDKNLLPYITHQDIRAFGIIPELLGRLPVLVHLDELDKHALTNILTQPKNALLKQYKKLFKMDGIDLEFDNDAIDFIVDKALEYKLGARGLRSICEAIITDAMYELPSKSEAQNYRITEAYVKKKLNKSKMAKLKVA
ncbi:MAG TPA: ATP-dependent Clp protease ATP-binding subunit ClpX [Chitinophagales bacterium]|jgi:ATP-dependent Clp protease ATP-binding subunit ClpX|nr:ATP-dependent Clp protease ATP-binding subunit ClpX [Chitinophagales bacterium]HQV78051.1 ATP-dependent Clp protease ATP-binding subunit ClpX [Chitinophagales bacterium]HQW80225.1 ATP-dependent Clp protease ATP-binding subunit ClpX [Chitinophagales bacterium]HRB68160.1 ATP-dependent Clp protease ATP-binding subunit ClpX [Chitinophagales bacterium]HRB92517.1 ATP-dependent Clp protease ATP-binding subunit ClpX [Chitinophagales bacterium]